MADTSAISTAVGTTLKTMDVRMKLMPRVYTILYYTRPVRKYSIAQEHVAEFRI